LHIVDLVIIAVIAVLLVLVVFFILIPSARAKKEAIRLQNERVALHIARAPYDAWAKEVNRIYTSLQYPTNAISLIEPPPLVRIDNPGAYFEDWVVRYEAAKQNVANTRAMLNEIKSEKDPFEQLVRLQLRKETFTQTLSAKELKSIASLKLELATTVAKSLWKKAQKGNKDALIELIGFTRHGGYQSYSEFTGQSFVEPDGWRQAISEHFEAPTLNLLRLDPMDDGELLLFAERTMRMRSVVSAKIVLAHWRIGQRYQLLIPQAWITELVELIDHHHEAHPITKQITT